MSESERESERGGSRVVYYCYAKHQALGTYLQIAVQSSDARIWVHVSALSLSLVGVCPCVTTLAFHTVLALYTLRNTGINLNINTGITDRYLCRRCMYR